MTMRRELAFLIAVVSVALSGFAIAQDEAPAAPATAPVQVSAPSVPTITPPVGKSGPMMKRARSSTVISSIRS